MDHLIIRIKLKSKRLVKKKGFNLSKFVETSSAAGFFLFFWAGRRCLYFGIFYIIVKSLLKDFSIGIIKPQNNIESFLNKYSMLDSSQRNLTICEFFIGAVEKESMLLTQNESMQISQLYHLFNPLIGQVEADLAAISRQIKIYEGSHPYRKRKCPAVEFSASHEQKAKGWPSLE